MTATDYGFPVTAECRVELPAPEAMNPAQRRIYDAVVSGPRGRMVGPLRAAIHSPDMADRWQKLGEFLRYNTVLPHRLNELAIITCGRRWNSDVEWSIHCGVARKAGLSEAVISAIDAGRAVPFDDPAEREIYDFTRELLHYGQVSDAAYAAVRTRWGDQGVVELTGLVGYYSMVAMMVNAHLIPIPEGEAPGVTPLGAELTTLGESEAGK